MMKTHAFLTLIAALALFQDTGARVVASAPDTYFEGRYLKAYNVAARNIEGQKGLPPEWRDREKYAVAFEGEKEGCYVMHFLPIRAEDKGKGGAIFFDTSPKRGLPVRIYVRKIDLKFVKGVVE